MRVEKELTGAIRATPPAVAAEADTTEAAAPQRGTTPVRRSSCGAHPRPGAGATTTTTTPPAAPVTHPGTVSWQRRISSAPAAHRLPLQLTPTRLPQVKRLSDVEHKREGEKEKKEKLFCRVRFFLPFFVFRSGCVWKSFSLGHLSTHTQVLCWIGTELFIIGLVQTAGRM